MINVFRAPDKNGRDAIAVLLSQQIENAGPIRIHSADATHKFQSNGDR